MKRPLFALVVTGLIFSSCASTPGDVPQAAEAGGEVSRKAEVLRHKGTDLGLDSYPVWLETYLASGVTGLEKMPDYSGFYCFVGESGGTDLRALQLWAEASASQAASLLAGERLLAKLTAKGKGDSRFAALTTELSGASYAGFRKINDWWVETRVNGNGTAYQVYVFYTIEKEILDQQILLRLEDAVGAHPTEEDRFQADSILAALSGGI
ncbi:MAG: hypothetical protein LBR23_08950 [Spirochaetaceae bacterium]|jgi:hypothetical protein|nr:hypothetical protein [Spirochaetaceae bacterium]